MKSKIIIFFVFALCLLGILSGCALPAKSESGLGAFVGKAIGAGTCTDSDGGEKTNIPGKTTGSDGNSLDRCIDTKKIMEYYCKNVLASKVKSSKSISCPARTTCKTVSENGVTAAACKPSTYVLECRDPDGEGSSTTNPMTKGTTIVVKKWDDDRVETIVSRTDACSSEKVNEFYCTSSGTSIINKAINCPSPKTCNDGVCKRVKKVLFCNIDWQAAEWGNPEPLSEHDLQNLISKVKENVFSTTETVLDVTVVTVAGPGHIIPLPDESLEDSYYIEGLRLAVPYCGGVDSIKQNDLFIFNFDLATFSYPAYYAYLDKVSPLLEHVSEIPFRSFLTVNEKEIQITQSINMFLKENP